jgi:GNAT superfamily N-acetyltransferase
MTLIVLPMEKEDTYDWAALYYPAFRQSAVSILWYSEPSPATIAKFGENLKKALETPNTYFYKVVDTELGNKIIAAAKFSVYEQPRSLEEIQKEEVMREVGPEENGEARLEFLRGIWASRREFSQQPNVMCDTLICHPDHHRRGAGRMLMQKGLDKADELGIPAYLEASPAGIHLYKKLGYLPLKEFMFEATKYGAKENDLHTVRSYAQSCYSNSSHGSSQ